MEKIGGKKKILRVRERERYYERGLRVWYSSNTIHTMEFSFVRKFNRANSITLLLRRLLTFVVCLIPLCWVEIPTILIFGMFNVKFVKQVEPEYVLL